MPEEALAASVADAVPANTVPTVAPTPVPAPDRLPLRLIALAALLIAMHGWVVAHIGSVWPMVIADVIAMAGALAQTLRKRQRAKIRQTQQDAMEAVLQAKVLLVTSIVFVMLGSFVSSVTVLSAGTLGVGTVMLAPETSPSRIVREVLQPVFPSEFRHELKDGADETRFLVLTNPFGRSFQLSAEQYQRYSFDVYPWVPTRIRVAHDLRLTPSLLVRLSADDEFLQGASTIELKNDDGRAVASASTTKGIGAVMFGPRRSIPDAFVYAWMRQLRMRQVPAEAQDRLIEGWLAAEVVSPKLPIEIGRTIAAKLKNDKGAVVGETTFVVASDALQDVMIGKKRE